MTVKRHILGLLMLAMALPAWCAQRYAAKGMVIEVDRERNSFVASCQEIPGLMKAMTMPFEVKQAKELDGLAPGTIVDFTLVVDGQTSYAQDVKVRPYVTAEQDPWTARQLSLYAK